MLEDYWIRNPTLLNIAPQIIEFEYQDYQI
jgi:hypothetical protein